MIIDGKNQIMGRIATFAAKKALLGEKIDIVNCEDVIITGKKEFLLKKFKEKQDKGDPYKGPFYSRLPDRIMRRAIRGMLPYKQERGQKAFRRVMCHIGIPMKCNEKDFIKVQGADYTKLKTLDFLHLRKVAKFLGKDM